jgi:flagellin
MAISLGINQGALRVNRELSKTANALSDSYARLSSGKRINRSGEDAVGLAIADSLSNSNRLMQVALRNANDGISAVAVADNALSEIQNILQRQSELAQQAANGFYTSSQRSVIQSEFNDLGSEIERIATATTFNGVALLSGGAAVVLQVGTDTTDLSQLTINGVQGTLQQIGLAAAGSSAMIYSLSGSTATESQSAARSALTGVSNAISSVSQRRGSLGVMETRLQSTISNLSVARENLSAAEGRIRDLDVAEEAANLTRLSILQQVGAAVSAQANQSPRIALSLLQ